MVVTGNDLAASVIRVLILGWMKVNAMGPLTFQRTDWAPLVSFMEEPSLADVGLSKKEQQAPKQSQPSQLCHLSRHRGERSPGF